jgi:D-3-phosphoglycerate dehydrogenase / 2-oxoglutarate reductase
VRSATKVTRKLLEHATALKVIGRAGIGIDNIDLPAATQRGMVVMNTPYGNSITTAEHAIALMFALAREIPAADQSTQAGKWEKARFMGVELFGKTLGVIGCGNIGAIVADRALGLKMKVAAYDPYLSPERALALGVEKVELDDLLARADFITLHTPLTDATRNLIDAKAIAKMKRGVRLINCARGGLVVEADLKAALDNGHVAGAALDVFPIEPAKENPLFGHPHVVATPHLGAATTEAQENVALQIAEQMADFLLTGAVSNALNMPSLTAEESARLKPYMKLAEQLGSFAGQLAEAPIASVVIEYEGHAAELNVKPLTAIVLTALLAPQLDSVNMVNAPVICRERDIRVSETRMNAEGDFHTLIRVKVATSDATRVVAGTLFGGSKPRITEVEGVPMEAELGSNTLFVRNKDKPGFIGNLGRTLGEAGINIASFHLGRSAPGEDAICLVQVDQSMDELVLSQLCTLPHVVQTKLLRF